MAIRPGRWRRWRRLLVLGAASALVSSCFAGSDVGPAPTAPSTSVAAGGGAPTQGQPSQNPAPAPEPPPDEGDCRRLSADDLRTIVDDSPTVPCRLRHTVVTFSVGRLPASATRDALSSSDERVESAADRFCRDRFRDRLGGDRTDRKLSMLAATYFLPSTEQFALGARWVRCDAYAYATPTKLADLPPSVANALDRDRLSARFDRCSAVSPSHRRFRHVICAQPHAWRAVATQRLGEKGERYPGRRTIQNRARDRCEGRVRNYLGTEGAFSYGFEVPKRAAWSEGDRLGLCWARTTE